MKALQEFAEVLRELSTPKLSEDVLRGPAYDYAKALAEDLQVDLAMVVPAIFGTASAALAPMAWIEVKQGWTEMLAFWAVVTARSGLRKSPAIERPAEVLQDWAEEQNELRGEYREALEDWWRQVDEEDKARLRQRYEKAKPPERVYCLYTDDITMEALTIALGRNNSAYGILSDEAHTIEKILGGAYGRNGETTNLSALLKGYTGSTLIRERVRDETNAYVRKPAVTCVLYAQEEVRKRLIDSHIYRNLGIVGRFHIITPEDTLGRRRMNSPAVPEDVEKRWRELMLQILEHLSRFYPTHERNDGYDIQGEPDEWPQKFLKRHTLRLAPGAFHLCMALGEEIEGHLGKGEALAELSDFGGKLLGQTCRVAGILHALDNPTDWPSRLISEECFARAIEFERYALGQIFAMVSVQVLDEQAEEIREYVLDICRDVAVDGIAGWSRLRRRVVGKRGRLQTAEELDKILGELEERNALVRDETLPSPKSRRFGGRWVIVGRE
jgi:hypothetical protein